MLQTDLFEKIHAFYGELRTFPIVISIFAGMKHNIPYVYRRNRKNKILLKSVIKTKPLVEHLRFLFIVPNPDEVAR